MALRPKSWTKTPGKKTEFQTGTIPPLSVRPRQPGDYYEPAFVSPDLITLRKVASPGTRAPLSVDAVRRAIVCSNIDFGAGIDEVRALTREP